MKLFKAKTKEQKQEEQSKKTIQDLIPVKAVENGLLITPNNKVIQLLKVSALNLELTSNAECNELFERYEGLLMSLTFPIQTTNISMPVDLKGYIEEQKNILKRTKNPYKRKLLKSYIEYAERIETQQDIMQRQRFILYYEQMKEDTPENRYKALLELEEKREDITSSLTELELEVDQVTDIEIIRYLHTLFDYDGAQNRPVQSTDIPNIITRGNDHEEQK